MKLSAKTSLRLLSFLPLLALVASCGSSSGTTGAAQRQYDTVTTMTGLRYIDYEQGTGAEVRSGMNVSIDYAGYLTDGTLFDTSIDSVGKLHTRSGRPFATLPDSLRKGPRFDRGGYPFEPIQFAVGQGAVIQGWDDGLTTNMRVGGRRRLIIPSEQAYGKSGRGSIPPNATLIFDVHVLSAR